MGTFAAPYNPQPELASPDCRHAKFSISGRVHRLRWVIREGTTKEEYVRAESVLAQAFAGTPPEHPSRVWILRRQAKLHRLMGDLAGAEEKLVQALALARKVLGWQHALTLRALVKLYDVRRWRFCTEKGDACMQPHEHSKALAAVCDEVYAEPLEAVSKEGPEWCAKLMLADKCVLMERWEAALELYRAAYARCADQATGKRIRAMIRECESYLDEGPIFDYDRELLPWQRR